MKQVQIKLTDEERTVTIYQPVCQNAATTAIVDTLIKVHPEWNDVARPNLQSVPRQIRKKVKANPYKHLQALSIRVRNTAPSHVITRFGGNF